jgi:hypothetical protein
MLMAESLWDTGFGNAVLIVIACLPLVCGFLGMKIGGQKHRSKAGFFALGFFLGLIGLIIASTYPPRVPPTADSPPRYDAA